jgi:branched-chain amino acid transport system substrate-binding protein
MLKTLEYNIKPERGDSALSNSKALTKTQSIILITVIAVASVSGIFAYILLSEQEQSADTIKIGLCADIDSFYGETFWHEAILAAEQVNAEGGVLGKQFEIVAEDDDSQSAVADVNVATNAFTRLITVDKADFVITSGIAFSSVYQELAYQHKKIMLDGFATADELTQKVLDDYDRYKYYFRVGIPNATSATEGGIDAIATIGKYTGFDKVALVLQGYELGADTLPDLIAGLREYDMEVVYTATIPADTADFSSYFAQAEDSGAEIMYTRNIMPAAAPAFVKEYYSRQSPMVLWGLIGGGALSNFWELTEGKCEYVSCNSYPTGVGYPLTNKTVAFTEAYVERWASASGLGAIYDVVRYILPDAISRAGTVETEAVIKTLETVDIETSLARHFLFTSSHDIFIGAAGPNNPTADYYLICIFQWQNGVLVPVYPEVLKEEADVTYIYPDWPGPWDQ